MVLGHIVRGTLAFLYCPHGLAMCKTEFVFSLSLFFCLVKRISTYESVLAPVSRGVGEVSSYIVLATSLVISLLRIFLIMSRADADQ